MRSHAESEDSDKYKNNISQLNNKNNEKIDETFKNAVNHHVDDGVCIVYSCPGGHGAC